MLQLDYSPTVNLRIAFPHSSFVSSLTKVTSQQVMNVSGPSVVVAMRTWPDRFALCLDGLVTTLGILRLACGGRVVYRATSESLTVTAQ